jgi:hypothetical protein
VKSITIHDLDEQLADLIRRKARADGTSLNRTIKKLLEQAVGMRPREEGLHTEAFAEFCGVWSEAELRELDESLASFEVVDEGDWR